MILSCHFETDALIIQDTGILSALHRAGDHALDDLAVEGEVHDHDGRHGDQHGGHLLGIIGGELALELGQRQRHRLQVDVVHQYQGE